MATQFYFHDSFDYEIRSERTKHLRGIKRYAAGSTVFIPEAHAEAAEQAGVGKRVEKEEPAAAPTPAPAPEPPARTAGKARGRRR
jgi:hypothetical protein